MRSRRAEGAGPGGTIDLREILIATGNVKKCGEIVSVLSEGGVGEVGLGGGVSRGMVRRVGGSEVCWVLLSELGKSIEEPHEDGARFEDNARLKAGYYARASGLWTLADDSGLEVDALGGAPGVISARYAGSAPGTPREIADAANNRKLIEALRGVPAERRTARFRCHLALSDGERILAEADGVIEGRIIDEARGAGGFGYDPHFLVVEMGMTTAELSGEEKNRVSHRGRALRGLRVKLMGLLR